MSFRFELRALCTLPYQASHQSLPSSLRALRLERWICGHASPACSSRQGSNNWGTPFYRR